MRTIDRKNKLIYTIGLLITFIIILLTIIFLAVKITQTDTPLETPKIKIRPTTPTPTQKPINKSPFTFIILNGSGVSKIAKKTSEQFVALGYSNITTGNADRNNYPKTIISFSDSLSPREKELILNDIRNIFPKTEEITDEKKLETSVKIIIGKE